MTHWSYLVPEGGSGYEREIDRVEINKARLGIIKKVETEGFGSRIWISKQGSSVITTSTGIQTIPYSLLGVILPTAEFWNAVEDGSRTLRSNLMGTKLTYINYIVHPITDDDLLQHYPSVVNSVSYDSQTEKGRTGLRGIKTEMAIVTSTGTFSASYAGSYYGSLLGVTSIFMPFVPIDNSRESIVCYASSTLLSSSDLTTSIGYFWDSYNNAVVVNSIFATSSFAASMATNQYPVFWVVQDKSYWTKQGILIASVWQALPDPISRDAVNTIVGTLISSYPTSLYSPLNTGVVIVGSDMFSAMMVGSMSTSGWTQPYFVASGTNLPM